MEKEMSMKRFHVGEVTDPHELLRSSCDKLIGCLIRGEYEEDYLLCIATDNAAPYYGDDGFRGESELLIYNPGLGEIYTSFGESGENTESSLTYLRGHCGLNKWELSELFGHDGPSSDLVGHISKLVAALPPDDDDCRTERDCDGCSVSDGRKIVQNIIARYGDGKPMQVRFIDDDVANAGRTVTDKVLADLGSIDPAGQWCVNTDDGHINPVVCVAPIRCRRTGKYVVGVWYDSMIEFGGDE
jgi:hypothetical protein